MKRILMLFILFLMFPFMVFADNVSFNDLISETKYYKTTISKYEFGGTVVIDTLEENYSYTEEISEIEYNLADTSLNANFLNSNRSVETTYKKMTTTISANGSKYRYQVTLVWKQLPSTRSYDIIGIGHNQNVKLGGNVNFLLTYGSNTSSSATIFTSSTGATATFKLPTGSVDGLSAKLYFDVEKNMSGTISSQSAYGDYAHATSKISLANAKKHTINKNGITHDSSVKSYFDDINPDVATWSGSW